MGVPLTAEYLDLSTNQPMRMIAFTVNGQWLQDYFGVDNETQLEALLLNDDSLCAQSESSPMVLNALEEHLGTHNVIQAKASLDSIIQSATLKAASQSLSDHPKIISHGTEIGH